MHVSFSRSSRFVFSENRGLPVDGIFWLLGKQNGSLWPTRFFLAIFFVHVAKKTIIHFNDSKEVRLPENSVAIGNIVPSSQKNVYRHHESASQLHFLKTKMEFKKFHLDLFFFHFNVLKHFQMRKTFFFEIV